MSAPYNISSPQYSITLTLVVALILLQCRASHAQFRTQDESNLSETAASATPHAQTQREAPGQSMGSQNLSFPATQWETVAAKSVGWNQRALNKAIDFAMQRKSSSVVITVGGRIIGERHAILKAPGFVYRRALHGTTTAGHQIEDVASVQKSVTSILLGVAIKKGLVRLNNPVHRHLGAGWSAATRRQEAAITVRHLITMTSGLNEQFEYQMPPGKQWQYNTKVYSKTLEVIEKASGQPRAKFTKEWLTGPLRMTDSKWVPRRVLGRETGVGFATTAHDLARFGLLVMNRGKWNGQEVVGNVSYLKAATSPSQRMNLSYGYLWWLNGQTSILRPGRNKKVAGPLIPTAPQDLFAAKGALGRKVYVVPSLKMVVTRLGDNPDGARKSKFETEFWRLLMRARK